MMDRGALPERTPWGSSGVLRVELGDALLQLGLREELPVSIPEDHLHAVCPSRFRPTQARWRLAGVVCEAGEMSRRALRRSSATARTVVGRGKLRAGATGQAGPARPTRYRGACDAHRRALRLRPLLRRAGGAGHLLDRGGLGDLDRLEARGGLVLDLRHHYAETACDRLEAAEIRKNYVEVQGSRSHPRVAAARLTRRRRG